MNLFKCSILMVIILLVACNENKRALNVKNEIAEQLKIIEKETELNLPLGAKLIQYSKPDVIVDPTWVAKISLPSASFDDFLRDISSKREDNTEYRGALSESTNWWKPEAVVLSKKYLVGSQTFVVVIVSKEEEEFFAYIECAIF